ncbi:MAG: DNA repair protein RecO [Phycisphaeraceae bacterium]
MPRFKDQAICIRHLDWSETSQIVVLMTRAHGKVRGLAKGSKRATPSSVQRFSGGIELLTRGEIVATTKATTELAQLTEWDLQDHYYHLRRDLSAQRLALYATDVVHALSADEDPHPRTFEALARFLIALGEGGRTAAALLRFQWVVLDDAGYRPELWRDVVEGETLPERGTYSFEPATGGFTARVGAREWRVRAATLGALRRTAGGEAAGGDDAVDVAGNVVGAVLEDQAGEDVTRANRLLCAYIRWLLDKELPTMRFVLDSA